MTDSSSSKNLYSFKPLDNKGQPYDLSQLKGQVVLIVNVASKCGFTPQYQGLEKLNKEYKDKGLTILGFPCNQFGGQEPGSADEIQSFCQLNYGVSFPVLGKVDVNGDNADPVWEWMKSEKTGLLGLKRIKWNFTKFLIDRNGNVVSRWGSMTTPDSLKSEIERELAKGGAPAAQESTKSEL